MRFKNKAKPAAQGHWEMKEVIWMGRYSAEEIFRMVEDEEVEIIRLQFTDILGRMKNVEITPSQLGNVMDRGCMIDGSCIEGFVRIDESDMFIKPDPDTFQMIPWDRQSGSTASMICDVYKAGGEPFEGDPRYILKRTLKAARDMGFRFQVGPECEFFLFHTDDEARPTTITHENAGYFDAGPIDLAGSIRRDIVLGLEEMGFDVEASHHELAPGQHEIDLEYREGIQVADDLMNFRLAVKSIAKRRGLHATFMPKPKAGVNGSGLHLHMSMTDLDGRNAFEDSEDALGLSENAYHFMAGILHHMRGMAILTNPIVNSYKRLVPGYDAPVHIAWSAGPNRSVLLRIPHRRGAHTRMELRCPDFSSNPYLVLAACLASGLDGINQGLKAPEPIDFNVASLSDEESAARGILMLPKTLGEAIEAFEADEFMRKLLGDHIYGKYLTAKKREWESFCTAVTEWEIEHFLYN